MGRMSVVAGLVGALVGQITLALGAEQSGVSVPPTDGSQVLYLNRCEGGEVFVPGFTDSRTNESSIVSGKCVLPEYPYGDASWNEVVAHVRDIFAPFDLTVTDIDPGDAAHYEAVVCGQPSDCGLPDGIHGISPFSCVVIENSITFTFAEALADVPREVAESVAQEAAHAWGLDHEFLCEDVMSHLTGCGPKYFRDWETACGAVSPRNCQCGGATQNSYRKLLAIFGPSGGMLTPPDVEFGGGGSDDCDVLVIQVVAADEDGIDRVELYLDGQFVDVRFAEPYEFVIEGVADGDHQVEARAYDRLGAMASTSVFIIVGCPCGASNECEVPEVCVSGRCVAGPDQLGGLGTPCGSGDNCLSGFCGNDGSEMFCTEPCDPGPDGCPSEFECLTGANESSGVCWPIADAGGCGCQVGARDDAPGRGALALLFALAALAFWRRRSSRL